MGDSNRVQVSGVAEVTWGTTPNSNFRAFPITGGSMADGLEVTRSQTIRSDAQLAASTRTAISPSVSYDFELTAQNYDQYLRSIFRSDADWSTAVNFSGTASSVQTTKKITGTGIHTNVTKGQYVYVAGFVNAATNGWHRVTAVTTGELTVAETIGADETSVSGVTVKGAQITNGSTAYSWSLQENFADLSNKWLIMTGCRPNGFRMSMTPGGIITCSMGFDGKSRAQATGGGGTGTVDAAYDEDPIAEVDGFDAVFIDDAQITVDITEFTLDVALQNRPLRGLGSAARSGINMGSLNVTGSIKMYRDDNTWTYETKLGAFTPFRLGVALDMGNSDRYIIDLPVCKFTGEPGSIGGLDQNTELAFTFAAEPGGSYGSSSLEKTIEWNRTQGA